MIERPAWLYTLQAIRPDMVKTGFTDAELEAYEAHSAYLTQLTSKGVLLLAGRTVGETVRGLAIIYADTEAQARTIMNADPFIARRVATATLEPFSLASGTAMPPEI